ncbi:MAG: TatD family hydrolase [Thermoplasmata archaeon]
MIIFDNHVHLKNESVEYFYRKFGMSGGTGLNIVNLTENCFTLDSFYQKYMETQAIAEKLKKKGLDVVVTIGPYPVNIIEMIKYMGIGEAIALYEKAVDISVQEIMEQRADAIGEVGRPHFQVDEKIIEASNEIMSYIFSVSKDNDIPVILHTESLDSHGMCEIMELASRIGKKDRIIKHFSQPIFSDNCGIIPSVPASRKNARNAPWGDEGFFLETDFAGDISKPNFVLPADSVPSRIKMLLQEGVDEDKIIKSMEFYRKFYRK